MKINKDNMIITVDTELGSNGEAIARALAQQLNVPCYAGEILDKAAELSGISARLLHRYDGRVVHAAYDLLAQDASALKMRSAADFVPAAPETPESMLADIWGIEEDSTSKVIYEKTGIQPKPFALLFEVDGDQDSELNVLYRVLPTSKPNAGSSTIEDTPTPVTQTFNFEALPLVTGTASQQGLIKARTAADTPTATRTSWFTAVNVPA